MKDTATIMLDTSGAGLHKRGYRAVGVVAPLRETLAAAMVMLSQYRGRDPFCDPFWRLGHHRHRGRPHCQEPGSRPGPVLLRSEVALAVLTGLDGRRQRGHGQGV